MKRSGKLTAAILCLAASATGGVYVTVNNVHVETKSTYEQRQKNGDGLTAEVETDRAKIMILTATLDAYTHALEASQQETKKTSCHQ